MYLSRVSNVRINLHKLSSLCFISVRDLGVVVGFLLIMASIQNILCSVLLLPLLLDTVNFVCSGCDSRVICDDPKEVLCFCYSS